MRESSRKQPGSLCRGSLTAHPPTLGELLWPSMMLPLPRGPALPDGSVMDCVISTWSRPARPLTSAFGSLLSGEAPQPVAGAPRICGESRPCAPSSERRRACLGGLPCLSLAWWLLPGGLDCLLVSTHAGGYWCFVGRGQAGVQCGEAADVTPVGVSVCWDTRGFAPWTWTVPVRAGGGPLGSCHGWKTVRGGTVWPP